MIFAAGTISQLLKDIEQLEADKAMLVEGIKELHSELMDHGMASPDIREHLETLLEKVKK